jgi:hypothetical protein
MSGWIFGIAMLVFMFGIGARFARRDRRRSDLARLDEEIRLAKFWGFSAETEQKDRADMIAEHKNWRKNIRFELGNWIAFLIGAAILLIAAVLWFGENPSHTWGQLQQRITDVVPYVFGFGFVCYYAFQMAKQIDKTESEVRWLNHMLKVVKDHAEDMRKGSIDDILELKKRPR